jgi:hypothetical protein
MTFRVAVNQPPLTVEFEAETLQEVSKTLLDGSTELSRIFAAISGVVNAGDSASEAPKATRKRRGASDATTEQPQTAAPAAVPPPPAPSAAPVVATAPAPIPVPAVATDPSQPPDLPDFLKRQQQTAQPQPVPPPAPTAPPAPVATARLAERVVVELKRRKDGSADNGAALAAWLSQSGVVVPNATFDEAVTVLNFFDDAKVKPIADALGVT